MTTTITTGERADILETLGKHRYLFTHTLRDLTDDQARSTPTASELSLGGLIKHVAATESDWAEFMVRGAAAMPAFAEMTEADWAARGDSFRMLPDETVAGVLAGYAEVAARTDELVATLDLDTAHPLPEAPWFEQGVSWSVRRTALHIIAETSQHAGHADIIRETLDGAKSMG